MDCTNNIARDRCPENIQISPESLEISENEPGTFNCTTHSDTAPAEVHLLNAQNTRIDMSEHYNTNITPLDISTLSITIYWPTNESAREDLSCIRCVFIYNSGTCHCISESISVTYLSGDTSK